MSRSRGWCFTKNFKKEEDLWLLNQMESDDRMEELFDEDEMKYMVFQHEKVKCDHLQGYIYFKQPKSLKQFKEIIADNILSCAHSEPSLASSILNKKYCTKEESRIAGPWEFGEEPKQGKRQDLDDVKKVLDSGNILDVMENHFGTWCKYHKAFDKYKFMRDLKNKQTRDVKVYCYHGPPGTGKTRKAWDENDDIYPLKIKKNQIWFDGYHGQKVLLIDEFCPKNIKLEELLVLIDRYPQICEVKGGTIIPQWTKVIITSQTPPDEWYDTSPEKEAALLRRFKKIVLTE